MKIRFQMDIRNGSMFQWFLIGVLVSAVVVTAQRRAECCQEYCYDRDDERQQSAHLSSKTSYLIVKGPESGRQYLVPNCKPTKIWMYSRHGTRLPTVNAIKRFRLLEDLRDEIIANYEKRHSKPAIGAMCEDDLNLLKQWHWNPNITEQYAEYLTVQGWEELKFTAIRFQRAFPNILLDTYNSANFAFRHTNSQRTEASFKAFVEGLFGPNAHQMIHVPTPPANDTLLKPYDNCPAFNNYDKKGDKTEFAKFLKSQTMTQLVNDVSQRLGYKFPLKPEQIFDMYDMCAMDQAWTLEKPSPWCTAFTPNQVNDIEYLEDLKAFYEYSYGRKPSARLACASVNDMIRHLDSNTGPNAVNYFAHSKGVVLLLTALHGAQDSEFIRADNYYNMLQRKWRLSDLTPFAANFAAVKYDCPNDVAREKVMFFLNEKPLYFNWCKVGLCSLNEVKERYKEYTDANCDEYFCSGYNSGSTLSTYIVSVLAPLFAVTLITLNA